MPKGRAAWRIKARERKIAYKRAAKGYYMRTGIWDYTYANNPWHRRLKKHEAKKAWNKLRESVNKPSTLSPEEVAANFAKIRKAMDSLGAVVVKASESVSHLMNALAEQEPFKSYVKAFDDGREDRRNHRPHRYGERPLSHWDDFSVERGYAEGWEEG